MKFTLPFLATTLLSLVHISFALPLLGLEKDSTGVAVPPVVAEAVNQQLPGDVSLLEKRLPEGPLSGVTGTISGVTGNLPVVGGVAGADGTSVLDDVTGELPVAGNLLVREEGSSGLGLVKDTTGVAVPPVVAEAVDQQLPGDVSLLDKRLPEGPLSGVTGTLSGVTGNLPVVGGVAGADGSVLDNVTGELPVAGDLLVREEGSGLGLVLPAPLTTAEETVENVVPRGDC